MKLKFANAFSLALIVAMLFTSAALADNVQNDIVVDPASITLQAGVPSSVVGVQFYVQATGGDLDAQCNFDTATEKVTFTINTPSGVTANPSSLTFNKCHDGSNFNYQSVNFSADASAVSGNVSFTQTFNNSGGTFDYSSAVFFITVTAPPPSNTAPTLSLPANITTEATSGAGALVNYIATASDTQDGSLTPTCSHASGSVFTLGTTTVNCSVTDSGGLSASGSFTVTVRDTTVPTVTVPANLTAEAAGPSGAVATFSASASDLVDGSLSATCSPASGSTFVLGTTTVSCSATDAAGNTGSASFSVSVVDTTPPTVNVPANMTVEATGPSGAAATFSASASDLVDGPLSATCSPASGSTFPLGATTVICSATDAAGNTGSASFSVSVVDTTPPTVTVPANIIAEATGPSGAAVTFSASASDLVDGGLTATCSPASGATFSLGTTTVNCSATDAAGNTGSASFPVTVQDTTAPTLTLPSNMTVSATSAAGAVVTFSASATDIVDGSVAVTCTPASGSTFAPGTTTVNCSATDAAGNTANGSFTVSVKFQLLGFYQPVDMGGVFNTVKGGSTVPFKFEIFAGATEVTNTSAISSLAAARVTCSGGGEDAIEITATGATSLRYDAVAGQFIYNWKTPIGANTCYKVTMTTADGSSLVAYFKLK